MLVDSHCHLDRLDKDPSQLHEVIQAATDAGVEHLLCVCVAVNDYETMLDKVKAYDNVSVSCGVHPLHQEDACSYDELIRYACRDEVVAIGETGLDYHYSPESKAVQIQSFIDHIKVANETNKPLIIHTRDAREDTIELLKQHKADHTKGVLHCFTESLEMAEAAMEMDFYISISGIVTFNGAKELKQVVKALPIERLLVETDSPWLAPVPHRGKQNQPAYVKEVAQYIADLKDIPLEELARITTDNFYRLFDRIERSHV
ncbi:putative metal-dependent hydrolase [Saliniradius amylolyticus]|uniref:Putative metal-dependent hydrolase n=1 Tax=Saliniradius amylolyticus TaxID=2183582 RepID=A0A2S2E4U6_9ALTE|nr:TatD family hydrolase [Saliniradius amylolyticus]AWL12017.1 putative metal-dependent hydrolase [Saliniradius amylolyticus]